MRIADGSGRRKSSSSSYENASSCTFTPQWVVRAGPREKVYFAPEEVHAAIVTCGGLCQGLTTSFDPSSGL